VYGRVYGGDTLTFEASGGLIHSALVIQDRETGSYWPIMVGEAIAGKKLGTKLSHLPFGEKMRWKDWLGKHPDTLVLSVNGREDAPDTYRGYYISSQGYRGAFAKDGRLRTKDPIFAFVLHGIAYAVPHKAVKDGETFDLGELKIFLYRPKKSKLNESTAAYFTKSGKFEMEKGIWRESHSGCTFNTETRRFEGKNATCPERLAGFDTFWYTWSLVHPNIKVLK
jgi:hypothetical protein